MISSGLEVRSDGHLPFDCTQIEPCDPISRDAELDQTIHLSYPAEIGYPIIIRLELAKMAKTFKLYGRETRQLVRFHTRVGSRVTLSS